MVRIEHIWDKELHCKVTVKHCASAAREHALMSMFDTPVIIKPLALRADTIVMPHCMERSAEGIAGYCSEQTAWKFLHDVAAGLVHIHGKGYIHHDIKPSNILITEGGFAIGDFGACFKTGDLSPCIEDDDTTHAFSAPEWSTDKKHTVPKSDIWALGASAFQIIMGVHIFNGRGGKAQKATTQIPSLPKDRYSKELSSLICACLAFNPEDRPDAGDIVETAHQKLDTTIKRERKIKIANSHAMLPEMHELWPEEMDARQFDNR